MRRRDFIGLIAVGSALPFTPSVARAQERVRRVGVLMHPPSDDPEGRLDGGVPARAAGGGLGGRPQCAGRNSLERAATSRACARMRRSWSRSIRMLSWPAPARPCRRCCRRPAPFRSYSRRPSIRSAPALSKSLARPGGNATGFLQFEYDLSGKWLELLKEVAPQVKRVGVMRTSATSGRSGQWAVIQAFSRAAGVELSPIDLRTAADIERGVTAFARSPNGGLIVVVSAQVMIHRELIISLAARHRWPAVYPYRSFVTAGGLISYGPELVGQYRLAAGYVDRILKGEKPADLPVQAPTKYELVYQPQDCKGARPRQCRRRCSPAPTR